MRLIPALKKLNPGIVVPPAYYGTEEEGVLVMANLKTMVRTF